MQQSLALFGTNEEENRKKREVSCSFFVILYPVTLTIGSGIEMENTKIKGSRLSTRPFLFDTKKIKTKKIVLLLFDYSFLKENEKTPCMIQLCAYI